MNYIKRIILLFIATLAFGSISAQSLDSIRFSAHLGVDIGAAVPWPLSKAVGDGDKLVAVPKVSPSIGISLGYNLHKNWSVNVEATYKSVALDATIVTLTNGQEFSDAGNKVLFRGKATTSMSFTMLEIPLYTRYAIDSKNAVLLGGYYSYIASAKFSALAIQGTVVNADTPDALPSPIYEGELPIQIFDNNLSNWDIGWLMGYERNITPKVSVSGHFIMGLKDIFKPGENYLSYSMLQMRGAITVSYRIY